MNLYKLLKDLIEANYYEKEDMTKDRKSVV